MTWANRMRGKFEDQGGLFSYVSPEARVPKDHPLRKIRELVRDVLRDLEPHIWPALFERRTSLDPA